VSGPNVSDLSPEQRPLYEDMREGIETNLKGFSDRSNGCADRAMEPLVRFPKYGAPVWSLVKAMSASPILPRPIRYGCEITRSL
jgi:4-carboxymuconolactone decarboxylase